jgi:RNA polymerase sigma-70 factor (ECF subfamily)
MTASLYSDRHGEIVTDEFRARRFDTTVMIHLDAAYNLARWLIRNPQDAEDCVQEACLRALRFFDGFRGGDARSWLLTIVRNTCYTWLQRSRAGGQTVEYDDEAMSLYRQEAGDTPAENENPEMQLLRQADGRWIESALNAMPPEFREVLVLRELEDLPYKQIADIAGVPIGTVMSRLARARAQLRKRLQAEREA